MSKKTERIISFICALFVLSTSFVFPASAAGSNITVNYDLTKNSNQGWFPTNSSGQDFFGNVLSFNASSIAYEIEDFASTIHTVYVTDAFVESRLEYGTGNHAWSSLLFKVTPSTSSLNNISFEDYDLQIYFEYSAIDSFDSTEADYQYDNFDYDLGLSYSDISKVGGHTPCIDSYSGAELINNFGEFVMDISENGRIYGSFLFEDTEDVSSILDGSFVVGIPWNNFIMSQEFDFSFNIKLVYTGSSSTTPPETTDKPDTPVVPDFPTDNNWGFQEPVIYEYDYPFPLSVGYGQITDKVTITDFYTKNGSLRFKDTTNNIFMSSLPFDLYDLFIGFSYNNGYSDSDFSDTVFRTFTTTVNKNMSTDLIYLNKDFSKLAFRLDLYISVGSGNTFDFNSYKDFIDKANTLFYGFEPFAIQAGSVHIPYSCWKVEFNSKGTCIRATLELDGKNPTHVDYMRALAAVSDELILTFTLGNKLTANGFTVGTTYNGFWEKYVDEGIIETPGDTPVTPPDEDVDSPSTDSGITKEELDAAFNKGYNQGIADGSDKNYVFGFVNGLFSGLGNFYSILANGISIGGITLGSIITSIIIVVVLVIVIKKVT